MARPDRPVRLQVLLKRHSPEYVEVEFYEAGVASVRAFHLPNANWGGAEIYPVGRNQHLLAASGWYDSEPGARVAAMGIKAPSDALP